MATVFSPDGKVIAVSCDDETVRFYHVATGQELIGLRGHQGPPGQLSFSPDGRYLVSGGADKTVRLWRAPSLQEIDAAEAAELARTFSPQSQSSKPQ